MIIACEENGIATPPVVDFICIGVQKAGTTWLHKMLGAHPDAFVAQGDDKDLRFFSFFYEFGYKWYENHFHDGIGAAKRGEVSTSYFYSKDAPERVYRYNPNARLLLLLRNPVERVISQHKHEIRIGHLSGELSIERALSTNPSYIEQSRYHSQLTRWLKYFPLSSFHIIIFEKLFADPSIELQRIYEFLGLQSDFLPRDLERKVNVGRIPRSRVVDRGVQLASMALRKVGLGSGVDMLKMMGLKEYMNVDAKEANSSLEVSKEIREKLRASFLVENKALEELLDLELSVWDH